MGSRLFFHKGCNYANKPIKRHFAHDLMFLLVGLKFLNGFFTTRIFLLADGNTMINLPKKRLL